MTSPLTTTSPLVVGRDRVEDKAGTPLAFVRWSQTAALKGLLRRVTQQAPGKGFALLDAAGAELCRVTDVSLRPGQEPTIVWSPDGTQIGGFTVVRAGMREFTYVLRDGTGAQLAEGRMATKVKYGDIPKKFTHAFEDAKGRRVASADRKPDGGPQRVGFDGSAPADLRLLVICLAIALPNEELGGSVRHEARPGLATGGLFPGPSLVYHRDRLGTPDGRMLATAREPFVAAHRGLSRALSAHPQAGAYNFEIADPEGRTLFGVHKSSGAVRYDIEVSDPGGGRLGSIKRTGGVYTVTAESGQAIAAIAATESFSSDYTVTDPGGAQLATLSRVQAVDEPWRIELSCDERLRVLVVAFVIVQELMLDL